MFLKIRNQSSNLIFISLVLLYVPLFQYYVNLNNIGGHSFMTADWLINYNFGYINRGLFGTILLNIFDNKHSILNALSVILILVYLSIFYFLSLTFKTRKQNIISIVLIFSPATFLFNIYDSQGSFRKEIIGILAILSLSSYLYKKNNKLIYLSSIVYSIGIFSHSVNLFFLITILIILFKFIKTNNLIHYLIFVIPTLLNFSFFFVFSNSENDLISKRDLMCLQLDKLDLANLCGYGAFDFLVLDLNAAYYITQNYVINENRSASYLYILLFLISIAPLLFDKNFYTNAKYYIIIAMSFIPLFIIAYDWGRWIYIMSICYLVIFLISEKNVLSINFAYLFIIFPIVFRIEHCCNPIFQLNLDYFLGNLTYLIKNIFLIF